MQTIVSRNTYRIPPRLRLVLSRLSSLILLFQRAPIVQFLFPEANIMGGGALANSFTLAVTTVIGLGAYDSVAGATTITQKTPIDSTSIKDVPAAVNTYLNFSFLCSGAPSIAELWLTTALPAGLTHANEVNNNTDSITGIPTATGKTVVTVTAQGHDSGEQKSQIFNIYVLGFAAQPLPTQTITSGSPATLDCTVAPNSYPASPTSAAPTYQWYLGTSGTGSLITGATSRTYSPTPSTTTNYWVKITSVLSTSTVSVNSNTAVVNVTTPATVAVTPTGILSNTSPITFTLTFSQSVTGLTTSGITVGNGTKGTLSGSGATYTLPVTPTGQGAVTCQVNAGAASGNTVSNTATVTYDSVAPTVAVTPTGTSTTNSPITFTLTFSEPVSGLAASGITVTNGTKGTLSGSGTTYTLPVTPSSLGAVTCQVNATAASDAATNTNTVSNTASVTYETVYSSWASVLPVDQRGPTQTPQNDGVTNLEKFAFNMDPTKPDVRMLTVGAGGTIGLPGQALAGGKLRLEFLRRKASTNPGITYTAQFGSDLAGWVDIPVGTPAGVPIGAPADPTWERVTVDDPSGGTSRFGRVKIVQP